MNKIKHSAVGLLPVIIRPYSAMARSVIKVNDLEHVKRCRVIWRLKRYIMIAIININACLQLISTRRTNIRPASGLIGK